MTAPTDAPLPTVELRDVDIVFADRPAEALRLLDAGRSREEILEATGAVIGAAGVSLAIAPGEICVLMGLSGSGKSTVLRAINGLNRVSRGAVLVADGGERVDVATCPPEVLRRLRQRRVAMVFQQFALLPWRTVRENVGFGLELAGVAEAERERVVGEKLAMVGLEKWADKFAHELSGGMQQRVGLARAFATDADILLMDEPFSALDPLIRTKLQDELLQLQKEMRKTIVFVSHDLDEALKIGDHIAILDGGRIVQYGPPEEIVLRPANDYVREFVANVNPLSVLTAYNVMRDMRDLEHMEPDWVWLDPRRVTRFRLDAERRVVDVVHEGSPATWVTCEEADEPKSADAVEVYWARTATPLKTLMYAMHRNVASVAVFDDDDRFVGAVGVGDVLQAVVRRQG
ncbi:MAG: choline ABC transporter ATP-binding protein [Siculibacillus sp.]|nr:choline ABC transporter ATP-binding protein [Siculibacillus sp.]